MQTMSKAAAALSALMFLAGCASGPSYQEAVGNIPVAAADQGRIYVYRVTTLGTAVQPAVRINGEQVGKAVPKGFFYVDRPAGNYQISASTEATRDLTVSLEAGEEKYVRLEMKMGVLAGHVKPVLVDREEGLAEIQKTKYIGK